MSGWSDQRRRRPESRLLRGRDSYIERYGQAAYDMMFGDCLWHVYAMIGKLTRRVYLLSHPPRPDPIVCSTSTVCCRQSRHMPLLPRAAIVDAVGLDLPGVDRRLLVGLAGFGEVREEVGPVAEFPAVEPGLQLAHDVIA
jgi:hypothetical protein